MTKQKLKFLIISFATATFISLILSLAMLKIKMDMETAKQILIQNGLAFLAPDSRGTANMISQAEKAGVPVKVIHVQ